MQGRAKQRSLMPTVVYAARSKSDEDGKDSTGDQIAAILVRMEREGERRIVGEAHVDHASGFRGNRGPGLAAAIEDATQAASEHGSAEIWVWHSNRLGRGTGRPGEARALGALLYSLQSVGVAVRSVEDDQFTTTPMLWSFLSEMASTYSETLSANVKRGKRARAMRGEWLGSIRLDGYMQVDGAMVKDPARSAIIELLWSMAREGRSVQAIQLEFSRRGFMTAAYRKDHRPRPFDVNRICQALDCQTYAGIVVHNGETLPVEGQWPRYVDPDDFYRLRGERRQRCNHTRRKVGRPVERYLLSELATCGLCGGALRVETGRRRKTDGTHARSYVCRAHREHHPEAREWCSAGPFDANTIDRSVLSDLGDMIRQKNGFAEALRAGRHAERERLTQAAAQARDEALAATRAAERAERRFANALEQDDDHIHQVLLNAASLKHTEVEQANIRMEAALDALHGMSGEPEGDPAELALGRLWAALSGRLEAADDVRTVNAALREDFLCFELHHADGGFGIVPRLNPDAAVLFDEGRLHAPDPNPQPLRSRPDAPDAATAGRRLSSIPSRHCERASAPGCGASPSRGSAGRSRGPGPAAGLTRRRSASTRSASWSTRKTGCCASTTSRGRGDPSERQLLVGERLEGHAMKGRDALPEDRLAMLRRGVADMIGEAPARVQLIRVAHVAVARDLRDDRGRRDRGARGVAVDDCALRTLELRHGEAVHQADHLAPQLTRDGPHRVAQGCEVRLVQPAGVDPADAARDDDDAGGAAQHQRVELLARETCVLLGVVQRLQRTQVADRQRVVVEQDARGDERPGERATPRLVSAGDEANAEATVEGEQPPPAAGPARPPPGPRRGARPLLRGPRCHGGAVDLATRGTRSGWEASRWRRLRR
jgi:DNA invertase Pin-like site-specific DNA recombinase